MARKLVIGNWKMFKTAETARSDFAEFCALTQKLSGKVDVGIAAPALFLSEMAAVRANHVSLYSQNCHWENEGAFTGEISPAMLKSCHLQGSLVAHSERRQYFGENDASAGKRVGALLNAGLEAVFCIGESLAERESGVLATVLRTQMFEGFAAAGPGLEAKILGSDPNSPRLAIAYEPVWAIGTGKAATPKEATEAHALVRSLLAERFGDEAANKVRLLYGGSVKPGNIVDFLKCKNVDGALVGGASLKPNEFAELCTKVTEVGDVK